eukprot:GEMP01013294.1.p1 GENE.GEMP01013294.1~~GEMP01013294.1.p1  ORF type:complete len:868 (+),score=172.07 GEMP01013294.1:45-2648(+)
MVLTNAETSKYSHRAEAISRKSYSGTPLCKTLKELVGDQGKHVDGPTEVRVIPPNRPATCPGKHRVRPKPTYVSETRPQTAVASTRYCVDKLEPRQIKVELFDPDSIHRHFVASLPNLGPQGLAIFQELRSIRAPYMRKVDVKMELLRSWELLLNFFDLRIERFAHQWSNTKKSSAQQGSSISICSSMCLGWEQPDGDGRQVRVEAHEGRNGHRVRCDLRCGDKVHFRFNLNARTLHELYEQAHSCGIGTWQSEMQDAQRRGEETLLRAHNELQNMQKRLSAYEWDSFTIPKASQYARVQLGTIGDILGAMMRVLGCVFPTAPIACDSLFQVFGVIVDRLLGLVALATKPRLLSHQRNLETLKLIDDAEAEETEEHQRKSIVTDGEKVTRASASPTSFAALRVKFRESMSDSIFISHNDFVDAGTQTTEQVEQMQDDENTPVRDSVQHRMHHDARWNAILARTGPTETMMSLHDVQQVAEEIFTVLKADIELVDPARTIMTYFLKIFGAKFEAENYVIKFLQSVESRKNEWLPGTYVLRALRFTPASEAFGRDAIFAFVATRHFCDECLLGPMGMLTFELGAKFLSVTLQMQEKRYGIGADGSGMIRPAHELWAKLENLGLRGASSADSRLELLRYTLCLRMGVDPTKRGTDEGPNISIFEAFVRAVDPQKVGHCPVDVFTSALADNFGHTMSFDTLDCFIEAEQFDVALFASTMASWKPLEHFPALDEEGFLEITALAWDRLDKCIDAALYDYFSTFASDARVQFTEFVSLCQKIDSALDVDKLVDMFEHGADQQDISAFGHGVDQIGVDAQAFVYTFRRYVRAVVYPSIKPDMSMTAIHDLLCQPRCDNDLLVRLRRLAKRETRQ